MLLKQYMFKYKGFLSWYFGMDFQFIICCVNFKGMMLLKWLEWFWDCKVLDKLVDEVFMVVFWYYFGEELFECGNLDVGCLSWLLGCEVVFVFELFDLMSYE